MNVKRTIGVAGRVCCWVLIIAYCVAALSPYISPGQFRWITLFNLAYLPLLILICLTAGVCLFLSKRQLLVITVVLALSYQSLLSTVGIQLTASSFQLEKQPGSLRVMSWNCNEFGTPFNRDWGIGEQKYLMAEVINQYQPDVLALMDVGVSSEKNSGVYDEKIQRIRTATGMSHYLFADIIRYEGPLYADRIGILLFSRFPFNDTSSFISRFPEKCGVANLTFDGRKISIITSHLSSMSLWPSIPGKAGLEYLKGDSTEIKTKSIVSKLLDFGDAHALEASIIRQHLDSVKGPLIFAGDLNSVPSSYVYRHIRKDLNDAFLSGDYGIGGTYNRIFPKPRIDVMFYSDELELVQFVRPASKLSDHFPLVADFRWRE